MYNSLLRVDVDVVYIGNIIAYTILLNNYRMYGL